MNAPNHGVVVAVGENTISVILSSGCEFLLTTKQAKLELVIAVLFGLVYGAFSFVISSE